MNQGDHILRLLRERQEEMSERAAAAGDPLAFLAVPESREAAREGVRVLDKGHDDVLGGWGGGRGGMKFPQVKKQLSVCCLLFVVCCLFVCLSVCLSCLFVRLSVCLSVCLFVRLFVCLFACCLLVFCVATGCAWRELASAAERYRRGSLVKLVFFRGDGKEERGEAERGTRGLGRFVHNRFGALFSREASPSGPKKRPREEQKTTKDSARRINDRRSEPIIPPWDDRE